MFLQIFDNKFDFLFFGQYLCNEMKNLSLSKIIEQFGKELNKISESSKVNSENKIILLSIKPIEPKTFEPNNFCVLSIDNYKKKWSEEYEKYSEILLTDEDYEKVKTLTKNWLKEVVCSYIDSINNEYYDELSVVVEYFTAVVYATAATQKESFANLKSTSQKILNENRELKELANKGLMVDMYSHQFNSLRLSMDYQISNLSGQKQLKEDWLHFRQIHDIFYPIITTIRKGVNGGFVRKYVNEFFGDVLKNKFWNDKKANFLFSKSFLEAEFNISKGCFAPVFVNLFENSLYWCFQNESVEEINIEVDYIVEEQTIVIKDNGVGIPDYKLKKIFELGYTERAHSGKGMGLYLVKEVLNNNGFLISATNDSKYNNGGACFLIKPKINK